MSEMDGTGNYVGFVGRLSEEKGVEVLMRAARMLPHIRFELAGHSERSPDIDSTPDNVIFRGEIGRSDLPVFYRRARFLVMPSVWYEGFGLVALEAMLQERAIIASDIGALSDIISVNVTGVLVQPGDAEELAKAVQTLWNCPRASVEMGLMGRKKALSEFSEESYFEKLMGVYIRARSIAESKCFVKHANSH
jgi:glycosyltransferase involved in cell wall biosynthesis